MESPPTGAPNGGGVSQNCVLRPVEKSPDQLKGSTIKNLAEEYAVSSTTDDHSHGPVDINKVGCTKVCS